MKVFIRDEAVADIEAAVRWIAKDNPAAAARMVVRVREQINRLAIASLVEMGRPGRVVGTRELVEFPYIVVYRILETRTEVHVLAMFHGAQDRP